MTPQGKELLTADIFARLPYGVKLNCVIDFSNDLETLENKDVVEFVPKDIALNYNGVVVYLEDNDEFDQDTMNAIKDYVESGFVTIDNLVPYLRPLSSATKEEMEEFEELFTSYSISEDRNTIYNSRRGDLDLKFVDWLNSHHFDYRGLIELGIALNAPEGMYNC